MILLQLHFLYIFATIVFICYYSSKKTTMVTERIMETQNQKPLIGRETSRYALVAKALRYKMTFSKSSKTDISCNVENQRKINTEKLIHLPSPNKSA